MRKQAQGSPSCPRSLPDLTRVRASHATPGHPTSGVDFPALVAAPCGKGGPGALLPTASPIQARAKGGRPRKAEEGRGPSVGATVADTRPRARSPGEPHAPGAVSRKVEGSGFWGLVLVFEVYAHLAEVVRSAVGVR